MSDQELKEITMFYAASIKAKCPSCGEWLDGWFGDPRGKEGVECEYCGAAFTVHPDADIEFDY